MSLDIHELLENAYKPLFPELLSMYNVDIEHEDLETGAWSGKVWQEREDQEGWYFPLCGVENANNGAQNYYSPIVFDAFTRFKNRTMRCYPTALDPMDFACVYLELREAQKQL